MHGEPAEDEAVAAENALFRDGLRDEDADVVALIDFLRTLTSVAACPEVDDDVEVREETHKVPDAVKVDVVSNTPLCDEPRDVDRN